MKIKTKIPFKTKDRQRVRSDDLIQEFLSCDMDDAVVFFNGLKEKDKQIVIVKSLILLLRDKLN